MSEEETIEHEAEIKTNGASAKGKVKFENTMPRQEAVAYFEAILQGLKQGKLHFKQGDKSVAVTPADQLSVEVKASRKGEREKISFELSWELEAKEEFEISADE